MPIEIYGICKPNWSQTSWNERARNANAYLQFIVDIDNNWPSYAGRWQWWYMNGLVPHCDVTRRRLALVGCGDLTSLFSSSLFRLVLDNLDSSELEHRQLNRNNISIAWTPNGFPDHSKYIKTNIFVRPEQDNWSHYKRTKDVDAYLFDISKDMNKDTHLLACASKTNY